MFSNHRPRKAFLITGVLFLMMFLSMTVSAEAAWKKNANGTYSYYSNGKLVKSQWIDGTYYVNSKGIRQTGWLYKGKKWYYFSKDGKLVKSKWIKSGNNVYYAGKNGALYTSGKYKIGNYYYGFNQRGVRLIRRQTINKKVYYFGPQTGRMLKSTWIATNKKYYYYGKDGAMVTSQWVGRYYVGTSGSRLTNTWKDNRYLNSTGKAVSGLQKISGTYYYFDTKTYKKVTNTTITVSGCTYKFDSSGKGKLISKNGVPVTTVNVESTYYTDKMVDDETLLASIIYCEAGNQIYEGKVAVGLVIMNRVYDSRFPSKLREIVYQKQQFTPARNGSLTKAIKTPSLVTAECKKAAKEVLQQFENYKTGTTIYLTLDGKKTAFPYLFFMTKAAYQSCGLSAAYKQIGAHVFFKNWC